MRFYYLVSNWFSCLSFNAVCKSISIFLRLLSLVHKVLESPHSLNLFPVSLYLVQLGPTNFQVLFCVHFLASHLPTSSCPTECRLSRSNSPWQCIVSLRFITDTQGQIVLGQVRNDVFGGVIYDQSEVEDQICWAQRAILNPKKLPKDFLDNKDEDELVSELNFSTNCVSLQISGPEVADLSFCDLPGMSYIFFSFFSYLIKYTLKTHQV